MIHSVPADTAFVLDRLSYKSPFSEDLLVKDLTLKISQGMHMLVVGNTGQGRPPCSGSSTACGNHAMVRFRDDRQ